MLVAGPCGAHAEPPNIIIILADDLGRGDLGCYGGTIAPTPRLDRMAAEGVRFEQAYVASPICSPSRCGLLTGQWPARWRITSFLQTRAGNRACGMADFLDPDAPSLPRALQGHGYATAHVGKWHLGGGRDVDGAPRFAMYGYDLGLGTWESPEPHPDLTATDWIWSDQDPIKRWDRTRWMVDRTLGFLRANPNRPCFVNLWLDDTHTPWVPSAAEQARKRPSSRAALGPVLEEMDRQVGRLLDAVGEAHPRPTLVLFLGDNGPLPTLDGARTEGLRGSKLSLYEGGIRVPLIAWGPGLVRSGVTNRQTVLAAVDLLPSLLAVAGVPPPRGVRPDGEDLAPALLGRGEPRRAAPLFWEYGRNAESFAYPRIARDRSPNLAMREGDRKLLVRDDGSGAELYDLGADPNETRNLADSEAGRTRLMVRRVLTWRRSMP
jgi:arylsulfatase A-like enzyme